MTTLADTKQMLKGYYTGMNACRSDLDLIEKYMHFSAEERKQKRHLFQKWFAHHAEMMIVQQFGGEDHYFFPEVMAKLMKEDESSMLEHLASQHKAAEALKQGIDKDFQPQHDAASSLKQSIENDFTKEGEEALLQHLREYVELVRKHIADEETMFVPLLMQYFSKEAFKEVEMKYVRSMSMSTSKALLPWMITRLGKKEREHFLADFPTPVRLMYQYWWEPAYLKKFKKEYDFLGKS